MIAIRKEVDIDALEGYHLTRSPDAKTALDLALTSIKHCLNKRKGTAIPSRDPAPDCQAMGDVNKALYCWLEVAKKCSDLLRIDCSECLVIIYHPGN